MAQACWQVRNCDEEMQGRCPHAPRGERCPVKCVVGICQRPARKHIRDFALYAGGLADAESVVKEECLYCETYLRSSARRQAQPR